MTMNRKRLLHIGVTLGLIIFGVIGYLVLTAQKPELKKIKPPVPKPMVRTINVTQGPQVVQITGEGTVQPLREIQLIPQVNGKVVFTSESLVNGGQFRQGDTLLRIDPADYRLAVTLARAKVKDSESKLRLAEEESAAAREEWRLLHAEDPFQRREPPPLVLKEPQLAAATAKLAADRADLQKAQLDLERTELKAPFNGRVGEETVDLGQYVSPGQSLAQLYSTEAAEIVVPLEDKYLSWFHVPGFTPGNNKKGSPATVKASIAGRERTWSGQVVRAEGKLDERTRMVNVVVRVDDPYETKPPLAVGFFVTVEIMGDTLPQAAVIPRSALREGEVVWVVDNDNRLNFRQVEVAARQHDDVIVKNGLQNGDAVVISPLQVVTDGMAVSPVCDTDQAQR
ncbi:MAG: efflux RND transporter periplasmic adaptor subunit [Thermodesulfobacteriota bacterium]